MKSTKKLRVWNLQAAVYSGLRRIHRNSPEYHQALKRAKSEYFILSKKGKKLRRVHFLCAICNLKFNRKGVAVDHIEPVVKLSGKGTFDEYIARLFCGVDGLQILCNTGKTSCHKRKTLIENQKRRKSKNEQRN